MISFFELCCSDDRKIRCFASSLPLNDWPLRLKGRKVPRLAPPPRRPLADDRDMARRYGAKRFSFGVEGAPLVTFAASLLAFSVLFNVFQD